MKKSRPGFRFYFLGLVFVGCLVMSSQISRSQSEKVVLSETGVLFESAIPPAEKIDLKVNRRGKTDTVFGKSVPGALVETVSAGTSSSAAKPRGGSAKAVQSAEDKKAIVVPAPRESAREKRSTALIRHEDIQGSINELPFERVVGWGVRFRYQTINQDRIGHVWFLKPQDLRGKTLRIYYSGIVPQEMIFRVSHSGNSAAMSERFILKDTFETKSVSMKVPNAAAFKEVKLFELEILKSSAGKSYGDFLIEKVEVLDGSEAPASAVREERTHPFPFGSAFLQPNVWGGEARLT